MSDFGGKIIYILYFRILMFYVFVYICIKELILGFFKDREISNELIKIRFVYK